jgi:hypothetical protein
MIKLLALKMDLCPVEIHAHIFQLACTDGGYTGRALSLVSKYFHDVSKPTKYYSVSCHGSWQAIEFLRLITNLPPRHRIVCHLFVTDAYPHHFHTTHPDSESGRVGRFNGLFDSGHNWDDFEYFERKGYLEELQTAPLSNIRRTVASLFTYFSDEARRYQIEARRQAIIDAELEPDIALTSNPEGLRRSRLHNLMADAVYGILEIIAPNLLSFSSSGEHSHYFPDTLARITLPKLTELTLPCTCPWWVTCPSLRRLNLFGHLSMQSWRLEQWAPVAPGLTHLCLDTGVFGYGMSLVDDFSSSGVGQSRSNREKQGAITQQYLSSSVQQIILSLEPRWHLESGDCIIQNILVRAEKDERIICLLRPGPAFQGLERWWVERMNGGEGCWKMEGRV